jgi:hypothetical protein
MEESVEIDLQGVGVQVNRSLSFVISLAEGEDVQSSAGGYAALDNITLHPCIDCSAPGKNKEIQFNISWRKLSWGRGGSKITKFVKVFFLKSFLLYGTIGQLL